MGDAPRRRRWPPPDAIAPVGRVAGTTTSGCLLLTGAAFVIASTDEFTCTRDCRMPAGFAGLVWLSALVLAGAGGAILWSVVVRPVASDGTAGWTWGLGAIFVLGVVAALTQVPGHTCPPGSHLDPYFSICIDMANPHRFPARSWTTLKTLALLVAVALGVTAMRSRRAVALTAPIAALTWLAGTGWLLANTMAKRA